MAQRLETQTLELVNQDCTFPAAGHMHQTASNGMQACFALQATAHHTTKE